MFASSLLIKSTIIHPDLNPYTKPLEKKQYVNPSKKVIDRVLSNEEPY